MKLTGQSCQDMNFYIASSSRNHFGSSSRSLMLIYRLPFRAAVPVVYHSWNGWRNSMLLPWRTSVVYTEVRAWLVQQGWLRLVWKRKNDAQLARQDCSRRRSPTNRASVGKSAHNAWPRSYSVWHKGCHGADRDLPTRSEVENELQLSIRLPFVHASHWRLVPCLRRSVSSWPSGQDYAAILRAVLQIPKHMRTCSSTTATDARFICRPDSATSARTTRRIS